VDCLICARGEPLGIIAVELERLAAAIAAAVTSEQKGGGQTLSQMWHESLTADAFAR
jgi:hypothetical protein